MTANRSAAREERIDRLERIVFALAEAAKRGLDPERTTDALRMALTAECLRCGAAVRGPELLLLARLPGLDDPPRIQRLRNGHCVRADCTFDHYRLHFRTHPDLNWSRLFTPPRPASDPPPAPTPDAPNEDYAEFAHERARRRRLIRSAILVAIILLLLFWRQVYIGGRIPLIREPENFRVDPWPPGYSEDGH